MKYPSMKMSPVKQEVILFTGGVNEEINSIQLKSGELSSCVNYEEVGGKNSGYTSIKGYERFNGMTAPSDISITTLEDGGIDGNTALLLEGDIGTTIADLSSYSVPITNTNVVASSARFKLNSASLYFDGTSSILASNTTELDFSQDFCLEFWIYYDSRFGTFDIVNKVNSLRLYLEDGYLKFRGSTDGIATDISLDADSFIPAGASWMHVAVTLEGTMLQFYFDGVAQSTSTTTTGYPFSNTNDATIGENLIGYLDCVRLSTGTHRFPQDFTPPVKPYTFNDFYLEYYDDEAREATRIAVLEVPGEDPVLGCIYYNDTVYAFRNSAAAGPTAKMYKSSATGWVEIVQPVGYEFERDGVFKFSKYRFQGYNNNDEVLIITDGVSIPRVFDGTTITPMTSTELPDNQTVSPKYAFISGTYNNRLFLGYREGSVVFSNVGNPTSYSSIIGGSGELFLGDELTNITSSPGNALALTCRNFIKILKDVEMSSSYVWSVALETFSDNRGAIANTAQSLLGDVYFADDEGITSLSAADTYGDFQVSVISNNVQNSFLDNKDLITDTLVDRSSNQYRLYFSDGEGFYFTFGSDKKVKGVTKIRYPVPVLSVTSGEDSSGNLRKFFTSNSGFVYEMDKGTSFDGSDITTLLVTAYYNYKSPRNWKHFKRAVVEVNAPKGLQIAYRSLFDYQEPAYPKTSLIDVVASGTLGIWGQDAWGEFSWGGSQVQRLAMYLRGSGVNMGFEVRTATKYKDTHTLHNGIVDYTIGSRQL